MNVFEAVHDWSTLIQCIIVTIKIFDKQQSQSKWSLAEKYVQLSCSIERPDFTFLQKTSRLQFLTKTKYGTLVLRVTILLPY